MAKKTKNQNDDATTAEATGGEAERPRCPTCGRLLPKPKKVDPEKVAAQKAKAEERLKKLQAQIAKTQERMEKLEALNGE